MLISVIISKFAYCGGIDLDVRNTLILINRLMFTNFFCIEMKNISLSVLMLLLSAAVVGCKSPKANVSAKVIIAGRVLDGGDRSPLRQAVVKRVSDGKAFLTDTLGNFHIEAQAGDSLKFSYVGTISRTLPIIRQDTLMTVELEPYMPGNDEYVCNEKYFGKFKDRSDGSSLEISRAENGYNVLIKLIRLTEIDDGIGKLKDGKLLFSGTDAYGSPISGVITVNGDTAMLVFTDSTWEYLPKGTTYTFEREDVLKAYPQKCYSTADGMTMKIVGPEPIKCPVDSLFVEFTNNRNMDMTTGEWYRIDVQSAKGNWEQAPYSGKYLELLAKGSEACFNDIGYVVRPDGTFKMTVKPWIYDLDDKSAKYRIVKTFHYPPYPIQKSDTAYVEFKIR